MSEKDEWFCGEAELEVKQTEPEVKQQKHKICVLCGEVYYGFGNNPAPLSLEGRCCNDCNNLVVAVRIAAVMK